MHLHINKQINKEMLIRKKFVCIYVCVCVCVHVWESACTCECRSLERPEEGDGYSETGVTDSGELPCGCWEWNPGPLPRTVKALKCSAMSPVPVLSVLELL